MTASLVCYVCLRQCAKEFSKAVEKLLHTPHGLCGKAFSMNFGVEGFWLILSVKGMHMENTLCIWLSFLSQGYIDFIDLFNMAPSTLSQLYCNKTAI